MFDVLVVSALGGISETLDRDAQSGAGMLFIIIIAYAWGVWLLWKAGSPEHGSFVTEQDRDVNPTTA